MTRTGTAVQRLIVASLLAVLLAACEGGKVDRGIRFVVFARPMPAEDVAILFKPGLVLSMEWADGSTGSMRFGADGDLQVTQDGRTAPGRWHMVDNRVCTDYGAAGGMCYVTYRRKDHYRMFDANGSLFGDARQAG